VNEKEGATSLKKTEARWQSRSRVKSQQNGGGGGGKKKRDHRPGRVARPWGGEVTTRRGRKGKWAPKRKGRADEIGAASAVKGEMRKRLE